MPCPRVRDYAPVSIMLLYRPIGHPTGSFAPSNLWGYARDAKFDGEYIPHTPFPFYLLMLRVTAPNSMSDFLLTDSLVEFSVIFQGWL
jgi:hypothetical protein